MSYRCVVLFGFDEYARSGFARTGVFRTPHGDIETPVFMPVGTQATVKSLETHEVADTGAKIILANTYHLWVRPGAERIGRLGGVRKFMRWPHALLTDSGGFQVFSLAKLRTIDDDGVTFRSHLDGAKMRLTPEESMRVQDLLGSTVAMAFDECPPGQAPRAEIQRAMERTTRWAARCLVAPKKDEQARFGIVQGGVHLDLRLEHLQAITGLSEEGRRFEGIALGGFSVGEPIPQMYETLAGMAHALPQDRPRYLMGVGTPYDLLHAIGCGIDLFDCVLPTRNARNGQALTWGGRVNLKQARHAEDQNPIDVNCACPACTRYTRAYVHHLIRAQEMLGAKLVTQHNLHFYLALTQKAREHIRLGDYDAWSTQTVATMRARDEVGPKDENPGPHPLHAHKH